MVLKAEHIDPMQLLAILYSILSPIAVTFCNSVLTRTDDRAL